MATTPPFAAEGEGSTGNNTNTLSTDELESWTLLDSSPRRSPNPVQMEPKKSSPQRKDCPSQVEDEEEDEEEVSEEESASEAEEEGEVEAPEEQEADEQPAVEADINEKKPSGVEAVKEKDASSGAARDKQQDAKPKKKDRKKRTDSERSVDSHDGFSSDGISVISESDGSSDALLASGSRDQQRHGRKHQPKVHLNKGIRLDTFADVLQPPSESKEQLQEQTQLRRKRSFSDGELVPDDAVVPWRAINRTSFVVLGVFVTAIAAILVGNSRMYTNRIDEYNFQHEQRISELELENNILKNEMNKLKHLYTQSELDEQVQQADSEWSKVLDEKLAEEQAQAEPEPTAEPDTEEKVEPLTFRKVSPQDEDIKHKVVWSGDDGQPMLIADKDYVLPDFCFNKNAVQDALFSEYTGKYCDIKKRKVEAKLRKAEFARKNHKRYREPKDYAEYIIPTEEEINEYQRQATAPPPKAPSLSPFDFDYQKAFQTIKEEGAVIVDSLVAILDLDPEPEYLPTPSPSISSASSTPEESSYSADDEASPSPAPSTDNVQQPEIRWESYPPWVKEKYQNQPEMYQKLRNKESLLWDWERKKNNFLHEVGLETLEEVNRKSEDELRKRREEYRGKDYPKQSGERRQEYQQQRKHDNRKEFHGKHYDERKGGKGRYDERKEWKDRPRNGDNRSHERNSQQQNDQQSAWKNDSNDNNRKPEQYEAGEPSRQKEWKNENHSREDSRRNDQPSDGSKQYHQDSRRESSGEGKPYHKKEWHSGERDNGKPHHKKEWKESSGDGKRYKKEWKDGSGERGGKPYHKKDWKESSGEHYKKESKEFSGEHSGRPHKKDYSGEQNKKDEWKKSSGEREHWKEGDKKELKRNGDQWNWNNGQQKPFKDDSGEDFSGEGSYLSQYRGEHHKKHRKDYRDDDDDDDDDHYKKHGKHHKNEEHWKKKKHHDGDRKWQEHSQERRR